MGLDQYAYIAMKAGAREEYYEQDGEWEADTNEWVVNGSIPEPRQIAYWRKHPNLQGWMERLWKQKGMPGADPEYLKEEFAPDFNGVELELTWNDLNDLENAVRNKQLPGTSGFFFGNDADEFYREHDLESIASAKAEIFLGFKVFYNSSW